MTILGVHGDWELVTLRVRVRCSTILGGGSCWVVGTAKVYGIEGCFDQ